MIKRCKFCAKKLNDAGYCTNEKCPENTRREIIMKENANETGVEREENNI